MTKRTPLRVIAVATFLAVVPLSGCAAQDQLRTEDMQGFGSLDEAYAAVDNVLRCKSDPVGEPTVPMSDGVRLTSGQKLCFEHVQIDLYPDQNALQEGYQILSDTNQGKFHLVHGKNWMVVDFRQMATGQPPTMNIEHLANEMNGVYAVVGA